MHDLEVLRECWTPRKMCATRPVSGTLVYAKEESSAVGPPLVSVSRDIAREPAPWGKIPTGETFRADDWNGKQGVVMLGSVFHRDRTGS